MPTLPARWDVSPGHAVRLTVQGGGDVLPGLCRSLPRVDRRAPFLCFPWTDGTPCLLTTGLAALARFHLPPQSTSGPTDSTDSRLVRKALLCLRSGLQRAGTRRPTCSVPLLGFPQFPAASRPSEPRSVGRGENPVSRCVSQIDRRDSWCPDETKRRAGPSPWVHGIGYVPRDLCVRTTPSSRLSNR